MGNVSLKVLEKSLNFLFKKGYKPCYFKKDKMKKALLAKKQPVSTNCGRVISTVMF